MQQCQSFNGSSLESFLFSEVKDQYHHSASSGRHCTIDDGIAPWQTCPCSCDNVSSGQPCLAAKSCIDPKTAVLSRERSRPERLTLPGTLGVTPPRWEDISRRHYEQQRTAAGQDPSQSYFRHFSDSDPSVSMRSYRKQCTVDDTGSSSTTFDEIEEENDPYLRKFRILGDLEERLRLFMLSLNSSSVLCLSAPAFALRTTHNGCHAEEVQPRPRISSTASVVSVAQLPFSPAPRAAAAAPPPPPTTPPFTTFSTQASYISKSALESSYVLLSVPNLRFQSHPKVRDKNSSKGEITRSNGKSRKENYLAQSLEESVLSHVGESHIIRRPFLTTRNYLDTRENNSKPVPRHLTAASGCKSGAQGSVLATRGVYPMSPGFHRRTPIVADYRITLPIPASEYGCQKEQIVLEPRSEGKADGLAKTHNKRPVMPRYIVTHGLIRQAETGSPNFGKGVRRGHLRTRYSPRSELYQNNSRQMMLRLN